jgi:hypothetical protein
MEQAEVLVVLVKMLRSLDAVDTTLTDAQIAAIRLPDTALLAHAGDQGPAHAKDLYARMVQALTLAHPKQVEPVITPQSPKVFARAITWDALAGEIADNTPDSVL